MSTLAKDVKFLKKNGLMDYSLFLVKYKKNLVRKEILENIPNESKINSEGEFISPTSRANSD